MSPLCHCFPAWIFWLGSSCLGPVLVKPSWFPGSERNGPPPRRLFPATPKLRALVDEVVQNLDRRSPQTSPLVFCAPVSQRPAAPACRCCAQNHDATGSAAPVVVWSAALPQGLPRDGAQPR